jgi:hypothetical protein
MIYKGYTNEYPLPDRNLGPYSLESFFLPLQKEGLILGRSPSAHITRNQQPHYRGADAASAGRLLLTLLVLSRQVRHSHQHSHGRTIQDGRSSPCMSMKSLHQALPEGLVILVFITLIHGNYLQQENSRGHAHPFLPVRPISTIREGHFLFMPLHRTTTTRTRSSTFSSLMS